MNLPPHLIAPLGVAGFVALWCCVCWLIARIGGWYTLASHFPAGAKKPAGVRLFSLQSLDLGASQYQNTACVGVAPEGLYLSVIMLFKAGHAPILIPWNAITQVKKEKRWWQTCYELSVPLEPFDTATITLFDATIIANIAHAAPQLPYLSIPATQQR